LRGKGICHTIPVESLAKARGPNNDSLHAARHARLVTLSETNGPAKVNEAILRTLICRETKTNKAIYQKEINFKPHMKLLFMVNDPPDWIGISKSYCTGAWPKFSAD
jgi:phage/plasmid-associated DNA primase